MQLDRAQQYAESAVTEIATELRNVDPDHLKIDDYRRVAEISSYWDTLGWVHFAKGDMQSAEKYVGAAWQLNHYGECGDHLAQIYEKTGRADKAAQMYAMALQTKHSYPEAREHLTALLKDKKKVDAALKQADQELALLTDINVGSVGPDKMQGNIALVFSPGPKVDAVKILGSGSKVMTSCATPSRSSRRRTMASRSRTILRRSWYAAARSPARQPDACWS